MMYLKEARRRGSNRSIGSAAAPPGGGVEEARRWILQVVVEVQAVAVRRSRRPCYLIFLASLARRSRQRARGASQRRVRPDPVEERRRGNGRSASAGSLSRGGARGRGEEPAPPPSLAPSSVAYYTWVLLYAILLMILFSPFYMFYISSRFYFLRTVTYNIAFTNCQKIYLGLYFFMIFREHKYDLSLESYDGIPRYGTGLAVTGSIDIYSVYATALRRAHPGAAGNY
ncbi:unnamed protein product [Urochloa humidicola]